MKKSKLKGIWRFSSLLSPIAQEFKLSLDEGNTKLIDFSDGIILKREDENPTGSLKDKGMAYLVSKAYSLGEKSLVLSSSGNAAISAAAYCRLAKIRLFVFVSPEIEKAKLLNLKKENVEILFSKRAVSDSFKFCRKYGFYDLRPSSNAFGPEGFKTIAFEIAENVGRIQDFFLPVSSGVSLVGIAEGFKKMGFLPKIHLCQSSAVFPLAGLFDKDFQPEKESLAKALVAKFSPLGKKVIQLVRESEGEGWVISNKEIKNTQNLLEKRKIFTSAEGALALAAIFKAKEKGLKLRKTVCLLTGKKY